MSGTEFDYVAIAQLVGVLMAAGLVAGFVAGLFGIGGGFVVVPALLVVFSYFGVEPSVVTHLAIGTSLATIIVTSSRSMYAHHKRGAVDFRIIRDWAPWLVLGVGGGIVLAQYMDGRSLKWIFSAGVFLMGLHFIMPVLKNIQVSDEMPGGVVRAGLASFLGGFSALLGIGGGTIAVLTMTMCGRPIHQAVATAAGFGVIIAVPGALGFALLGQGQADLPIGSFGYVNLVAVAAITVMSFITAPLGARAAHSLNAAALKRVFGVYLVATSAIVLQNSFAV
ncbi:MAG: sulfite exporter TauE/SafE family protein [Pseudomonadota bacterium]